jgi:hypothetical protein
MQNLKCWHFYDFETSFSFVGNYRYIPQNQVKVTGYNAAEATGSRASAGEAATHNASASITTGPNTLAEATGHNASSSATTGPNALAEATGHNASFFLFIHCFTR